MPFRLSLSTERYIALTLMLRQGFHGTEKASVVRRELVVRGLMRSAFFHVLPENLLGIYGIMVSGTVQEDYDVVGCVEKCDRMG